MAAQEEHHHTEESLKILFKGVIPIIFFIGGIVVLVTRIPFVSIFLGFPLIIIGLAMLINVLDEITSATILPKPHLTSCAVCGKATPVLPGIPENDTICAKCKQDIMKGIAKERK